VTRFFSEHYAAQSTAVVAPPTVLPPVTSKAPEGLFAVPLVMSRSKMDFTAGAAMPAGDEIRLFPMRSGDRLWHLYGYWDVTAFESALNFNFGLAHQGDAHDGAVIDAALFASGTSLDTAGNQRELLIEALARTHSDRGLFVWEFANLGGESFAVDPQDSYDLIATVSGATFVSHGIFIVEAWFTQAGY
jgi:hypothetical protein